MLRLGFLLTDGKSAQKDFNKTLAALRDFNVTMYGIGVGQVNRSELELITGDKDKVIYAEKFEKLHEIEKVKRTKWCFGYVGW